MKDDKPALLDCPFCGQSDDVLRVVRVTHLRNRVVTGKSRRVFCTGCGAKVPLENWNTRIKRA